MIRVESLGHRFSSDSPWIYQGIDFQLKQGECLAILGPSGSGKTVLLKSMAGLILPAEGRVKIGTQDLGMLFQKNALFDSMSALENLLFPLREKKSFSIAEAKERSLEMLKSVGLETSAHLFPDELSGGMQKRLGLARAWMMEPEVLFYDEPTAGLDPVTSRSIAALMRQRARNLGTTSIVVTNEVARALQLGDSVALLAAGRLTSPLSPDAFSQSQDESIRQFIEGRLTGPLTRTRENGALK
jgi:phospholipid/cholesterol/gamma-HCH transport system ATP-binding protein